MQRNFLPSRRCSYHLLTTCTEPPASGLATGQQITQQAVLADRVAAFVADPDPGFATGPGFCRRLSQSRQRLRQSVLTQPVNHLKRQSRLHQGAAQQGVHLLALFPAISHVSGQWCRYVQRQQQVMFKAALLSQYGLKPGAVSLFGQKALRRLSGQPFLQRALVSDVPARRVSSAR